MLHASADECGWRKYPAASGCVRVHQHNQEYNAEADVMEAIFSARQEKLDELIDSALRALFYGESSFSWLENSLENSEHG